jgi:hypothetical protein
MESGLFVGIRFLFVLLYVWCEPIRAVGGFPGQVERELGAFGQYLVIEFVGGIGWAVVVGMGTVEIENGRNAFFCKIVVLN